MGNLVQGIGTLLGGGNNNSNFQAAQGANTQQAGTAYDQTQQGIAAQQALMHALAGQQGIQNQSSVFNQLQNVASGVGPNPAQAMLAQQTGNNVANQAALMAGQRGAGANAGLIARQAGQEGGNLQQQAVGQGATMQAQQQLGALNQLGGIAGQQVGQQIGATQGLNQAAQGQQGNLLGAISGQNSVNGGMAGINAKNSANAIGGLANAAGSAIGFLAHGGEVPNPKIAAVAPEKRFSSKVLAPHVEHMAKLYHPHMFAEGGQASSNWGSGQDAAKGVQSGVAKAAADNPISKAIAWVSKADGGPVPGKAKVKGDSYSNDTVPAMLSPGEVVIPRHIMQSDNPIDGAAEFVKKLVEKSGEHKDFKDSLKKAIASRKG